MSVQINEQGNTTKFFDKNVPIETLKSKFISNKSFDRNALQGFDLTKNNKLSAGKIKDRLLNEELRFSDIVELVQGIRFHDGVAWRVLKVITKKSGDKYLRFAPENGKQTSFLKIYPIVKTKSNLLNFLQNRGDDAVPIDLGKDVISLKNKEFDTDLYWQNICYRNKGKLYVNENGIIGLLRGSGSSVTHDTIQAALKGKSFFLGSMGVQKCVEIDSLTKKDGNVVYSARSCGAPRLPTTLPTIPNKKAAAKAKAKAEREAEREAKKAKAAEKKAEREAKKAKAAEKKAAAKAEREAKKAEREAKKAAAKAKKAAEKKAAAKTKAAEKGIDYKNEILAALAYHEHEINEKGEVERAKKEFKEDVLNLAEFATKELSDSEERSEIIFEIIYELSRSSILSRKSRLYEKIAQVFDLSTENYSDKHGVPDDHYDSYVNEISDELRNKFGLDDYLENAKNDEELIAKIQQNAWYTWQRANVTTIDFYTSKVKGLGKVVGDREGKNKKETETNISFYKKQIKEWQEASREAHDMVNKYGLMALNFATDPANSGKSIPSLKKGKKNGNGVTSKKFQAATNPETTEITMLVPRKKKSKKKKKKRRLIS